MCAGCVPGNDLPLTYLTLAAARGALTWHRYVGVATAAVAGPPPAALPPTAAGVRSDREGASGGGGGGQTSGCSRRALPPASTGSHSQNANYACMQIPWLEGST